MDDGKATVVSRLMAVKSNSGKPYSQIAEETELTNVYVAQLLKRQAQLKPGTASKLRAALPDLPDELVEEMMKPPMRSYNPNLIQEPTIYRLNEAVMHFGESIKEIINEEFGDGIMSAIDFYCSVDKAKGADGMDRVVLTFDGKYLPYAEQTNVSTSCNTVGTESQLEVSTRCNTVGTESQTDVSTRSSEVVSECVMDYSSEFTTYEIFKSRDALVQWTREVGKRNGLVIVIKTSDAGGHGRRPRVTFACERGGNYRRGRVKEGQIKKRPNMSGTKKCCCPFALKGQKLAANDDWMLEVVCGVHNHSASEHREGHSYAGRLSQEETSLLVDLSKSSVRPKDILTTLKKRDALNVTTMKTIYNARQRFKVSGKARRPETQQPTEV